MTMKRTTTMITLVLLASLAFAPVFGATSRQYRGPAGENPRGLFAPGSGVIGTSRLGSKSRQVEGEARWEFWWETNRDRFLRRALDANTGQIAGDATFPALAGAGDEDELISRDDIRKRIVPLLLARLDSSDSEERALAAFALGKARVPEAFGPLRKMLAERDGGERRAAALALGFMAEPLAAPALIEFIGRRGVSPAERAYGALALGFLGSQEGAPALRLALVESFEYRGQAIEEFRAAVVAALGMLRDKESVPILRRVLQSPTSGAEIRAASVIALGRIGDGAGIAAVMKGVEDNHVEVRRAAVQALGIFGDALAKPALIQAFEQDGDVQVRNFAAIALAEIGGSGVLNPLVSGLARTNPRALRGYSALALGILGDASAVPELRKIIEMKDESSLRGAAAIGLALLGDLGSKPRLREFAADEAEDDGLRSYAIMALSLQGDPVMRARLPGLSVEAVSSEVRRSATLSFGLYRQIPAGRPILSSILAETDAHVRGAAVAALSLRPRKDVLDELLTVASVPGVVSDMRKDALVALGAIAMAGEVSPVERMLKHLNHRSVSGAVAGVLYLL
jgi:HEAT repeat protein